MKKFLHRLWYGSYTRARWTVGEGDAYIPALIRGKKGKERVELALAGPGGWSKPALPYFVRHDGVDGEGFARIGPPQGLLLTKGRVEAYEDQITGGVILKGGGQYLPIREITPDGVYLEGEEELTPARKVQEIFLPRKSSGLHLGNLELRKEGGTDAAIEGWPTFLPIYVRN